MYKHKDISSNNLFVYGPILQFHFYTVSYFKCVPINIGQIGKEDQQGQQGPLLVVVEATWDEIQVQE